MLRSYYFLFTSLLILNILLPIQRCDAQKDPLFDDDDTVDEYDLLDEDEPVIKPIPTSKPIVQEQKQKKSKPIPVVEDIETGEEIIPDEDEFVGFENTQATSTKQKKEKFNAKLKPTTTTQVTFSLSNPSTYWPELCAILLLIIYGINFFIGRSTNDTIANTWYTSISPFISQQFAATGINDLQLMMDNNQQTIKHVDEQFNAGNVAAPRRAVPLLVKDSASSYKLYATGRRYCTGMLATIELKQRQDLFSWVLALAEMSTTRDTVTYEIPMSDDCMNPFVFAIIRRKNEKNIRKQEKDLENYGTVVKTTRLPATMMILSDTPELESELMDDKVARTLTDLDPYFISLHLSDQTTSTFNTTKKVCRFTFLLPTDDLTKMDIIYKYTMMMIYMIDKIGTMNFTSAMKTRAENKRKAVADKAYRAQHQQRQEELLRRKAELKRKETENAPPLSAEAQRKKEEREYKLQQKKMKPRVKMVR